MIINDRDGYNKVQETFVMHKKGDVIIMRAEQNFKWEKLSLGTCYYPEHWDKSLWRDDLRRMKENLPDSLKTIGNACSDHSDGTLNNQAEGLLQGIKNYFGK